MKTDKQNIAAEIGSNRKRFLNFRFYGNGSLKTATMGGKKLSWNQDGSMISSSKEEGEFKEGMLYLIGSRAYYNVFFHLFL